jgi:pyroglutamyl-peptidase
MILLTGFEPFGGDAHNPSSVISRSLDGTVLAGVRVRSAVLPVDGARVGPELERQLAGDVRAVVMLGLARGRHQVALERVAVNRAEYRIPDNAGRTRSGEALFPGGPDAIFSSLPLERILEAWRSAALPGYVSESAGLYLCNQAFYSVRHLRPNLPAGFIHLPSDETLALHGREPFVPLEWQRQSVAVALGELARFLTED